MSKKIALGICKYCNTKLSKKENEDNYHFIRRIYCGNVCRGKDKVPWNKGLTKEIDSRVLKYTKTLTSELRSKIVKESHKNMSKKQREKRAMNISISKKGILFSDEHRKNISNSKIGKRTGKDNNMWKGGVTELNDKIRKSAIYNKWRIAVYKKDYYTCQQCGYNKGYIAAHHIYPFSIYPEYRFEVKNGTTLCKSCHPHIEAIT